MIEFLHEGGLFLMGEIDAHAFQAWCEFLEINNVVSVFVKFGQKVNNEFL